MKMEFKKIKTEMKMVIILAIGVIVFGLILYYLFSVEKIEELPAPIKEESQVQVKNNGLEIDESTIKNEILDEENKNIQKNEGKRLDEKKDISQNLNSPDLVAPKDMRDYLKSIQKEISLNSKIFVYHGKTYQDGDMFKGYLIESISPVYIRFFNNKTGLHYNLRFLEGVKK